MLQEVGSSYFPSIAEIETALSCLTTYEFDGDIIDRKRTLIVNAAYQILLERRGEEYKPESAEPAWAPEEEESESQTGSLLTSRSSPAIFGGGDRRKDYASGLRLPLLKFSVNPGQG